MEKIIIVGEKEALSRMEFIKTIIASNAAEILLISPEEYAKISNEEIKKVDKVLILHDTPPEKLKKEIKKEFNKIFELKPQEAIGDMPLIDQTPRYDKFIKKGGIKNSRTSKQQFKKKGNKRK